MKHLVVMGGGTGTYVVLSGLKQYPVMLSAIVSVADSGGSTGRLVDEFGFLPVGDLRQALAALAPDTRESWLKQLLLYRFAKGSGLSGHNLGNLLLTALQDMTGSTAKAVAVATQIFRLHGSIYPSTTQKVDLVVEYNDGSFIIGEHHLNPQSVGGKTIRRIRLSPTAPLYPPAQAAIKAADLVIIGPGDLYASIMPNLVVRGMKQALKESQCKLVYIVNLMTIYTQTHRLTAANHVAVIEKRLGRSCDYLILNTDPIPARILSAYAAEKGYPVIDDLPHNQKIIRAPLIRRTLLKPVPGDTTKRGYLRHNSVLVSKILMRLVTAT